MTDDRARQEAAYIQNFEEAGEAQVRLMLATDQYPRAVRRLAAQWLSDQDSLNAASGPLGRRRQATRIRFRDWRESASAIAALLAAFGLVIVVAAVLYRLFR